MLASYISNILMNTACRASASVFKQLVVSRRMSGRPDKTAAVVGDAFSDVQCLVVVIISEIRLI